MNFLKKFCMIAGVSLLWAGTVAAQPAAFSLLSPANNDTLRGAKVYYQCQSSAGAAAYELWVDNVKRGQITANAKTPTQICFDSVALTTGAHSWYFVAVNAASQRTQSGATFSFTLLSFPVLPYWAIGPFQKYGANPLISPQGSGTGWESKAAFNPGVIVDDTGCFQMVFRAQDQTNAYSQIGYAHGVDGVTFTQNANPVIPNTGTGESHGCEDPRLVKLVGANGKDSIHFCYYASYDGSKVAICVASSPDMVNWTKYGPQLSNTKNACILMNSNGTPTKINGKYYMYNGDQGFTNNTLYLASSTDLIHWTQTATVDLRLGTDQWEPCAAIADASPNGDDIILFFAGKLWGDVWFNSSNPLWYYYAISEILLTKSNMTERLDKLDGMIMLPNKPYEASGVTNNCIFSNCILKQGNTWWHHYGAADTRVALALSPARNIVLGPNLAKGKTATASSTVQAAANAVDSNCATRWESAASDSQWVMVDLGASYNVNRVILKWEAAYGASYRIQVSGNASAWTDAYSTTTGNGDVDDIILQSVMQGRYVRMLGSKRGTTYGYSLWEFEVYGTSAANIAAPAMNARAENNLFANPTSITYSLAKARTVTLAVYSAQGKLIARMNREGRAGANTLRDWREFNRLPEGMYCVGLCVQGKESIFARMVKMR